VSDLVELSIPVDGDLIVLARMTAATVATRAGFDVEQIEDLRLAVDELCVSVMGGARDGRLALEFIRDGEAVEVTCAFVPGSGSTARSTDPDALGGLSEQIIEALVDEYDRTSGDGVDRAWLRKRRTSRPI
jgi:serine/threonine-protein kinase RsbW